MTHLVTIDHNNIMCASGVSLQRMKNDIILVDSDVEGDVEGDTSCRKRVKLDDLDVTDSVSDNNVSCERIVDGQSQDQEQPQPIPTHTDDESDESINPVYDSDLESMHTTDGESDRNTLNLLSPESNHLAVTNTAAIRAFLKEHGPDLFLEKFLPIALSTQDITDLIVKLGFRPPVPENEDDEINMMQLVRYLNFAMTRVLSTRERLSHVSNIDDVISLIRASSKIIVITGAGISTSLGIPDFRSSRGFYAHVERLGLSDPQEVFDLNLFYADPTLFYSIAHMILPPSNVYSPLHSFIAVLQQQNKLLRNYTQNIDNLESCAGISREKVVQCHGLFAHATCVTCQYRVEGEEIFDDLRAQKIAFCPKCTPKRLRLLNSDDDNLVIPESYGVFKPDITFFGELLPDSFHDKINNDLGNCDLIIAIGTSLKVAPVADIVLRAPQHVPQILINHDPISHCQFDVSLLGYCDDVASYLANKLGPEWELLHPQYRSICGQDGENLELHLGNVDLREYYIKNKSTNKVSGDNDCDDKDKSDDSSTDGISTNVQSHTDQESGESKAI